MSGAISGLDHLLIGTADLEAARRRYQALGFTLTPRGRHIGWGTANYCIMFPDDYLELLGIVDANQFTNNLDRFLESEGEGLLGLAFRGDDLKISAERLRAAGIAGEGPKDLKRILELPDGEVLPRFQLLHLPTEATPGVKAFICKHLTPEIVWQEPWLAHANGACRVAGTTILCKDPATLAPAYRCLFGEAAVALDGGMLTVDSGACRLRFARPEALSQEEQHLLAKTREGPRLMTLGVNAIEQTAAHLHQAGIEARPLPDDGANRLGVAAEDACGVALVFQEV